MKSTYINIYTKAAPLAVFRMLFGLMMCISMVRFWAKGWIEAVYIEPQFFFSYYGFEFVKPLGEWTYLLFAISILASIGICLGYYYRLSAICFFLSFTYVELIDKTPYLNHYYFVSLMSFILVFLPANAYFSIDANRNKKLQVDEIPKWAIDSVKLLLGIVYFYAGLAKLNSDWLFHAQPLKIWLTNKANMPLIGEVLKWKFTPYIFSWAGMLFDISVAFFLLNRKTRIWAYMSLVAFHLLTGLLFPIGMFPYIMIAGTLIFFEAKFHEKVIQFLRKTFKGSCQYSISSTPFLYTEKKRKIILSVLFIFFVIQLLLPWRYLAYPGELFWTEEGYRFSWRVMLMEKVGVTYFDIYEPSTGKRFEVENEMFLTPFQIKQMSTQPDFILQFAHFLKDHFSKQGIKKPEVYVKSFVTLNGRASKPFIDPSVNLANEKESFRYKKWILPFQGTIKGL